MSPDGAVRALVGGRDYAESQFNRATQALRQPGSAFKPFVYLAALEHGMSPDDRFNDGPSASATGTPRNYENKIPRRGHRRRGAGGFDQHRGGAGAGARRHRQRHRGAPIASASPAISRRDASLALGTSEVTLLDLTSAYCAFASGGRAALPYGIIEIRDRNGAVLYKRQGDGGGQVIAPELAGEMNMMLAGVIAHGTGRAAQLDRPVAGKTGTTQDSHDAWFVGYTADLVAGVWLGNDDNAAMNRVTGGTLPARTWHAFMAQATQGMPVRPLPHARADAGDRRSRRPSRRPKPGSAGCCTASSAATAARAAPGAGRAAPDLRAADAMVRAAGRTPLPRRVPTCPGHARCAIIAAPCPCAISTSCSSRHRWR